MHSTSHAVNKSLLCPAAAAVEERFPSSCYGFAIEDYRFPTSCAFCSKGAVMEDLASLAAVLSVPKQLIWNNLNSLAAAVLPIQLRKICFEQRAAGEKILTHFDD